MRTSRESPKLSTRIEEEQETQPEEVVEDNTKNIKLNKTPEPAVKHEKESLSTKFKNFRKAKSEMVHSFNDRIIIGGENESQTIHHSTSNRLSSELLRKFEGKTREVMIININ